MDKEDWKPLSITAWLKSQCIYLLYGKSICCAKKRELFESMAESSVSFSKRTPVSKASSTMCVTETTPCWTALLSTLTAWDCTFQEEGRTKEVTDSSTNGRFRLEDRHFWKLSVQCIFFAIKKATFYWMAKHMLH